MDQVKTRRRIEKPIGLYILSVFDFIAVGLTPLLLVVLSLRNTELELPFSAVLVSVALPIFVMAASMWAAVGDHPARYVLLALVTLMSILLIINNLILLTSEIPRSRIRSSVGTIVRATFWLAINWWYLNRSHVVAFFKQNQ